jgi:hypothetical protein
MIPGVIQLDSRLDCTWFKVKFNKTERVALADQTLQRSNMSENMGIPRMEIAGRIDPNLFIGFWWTQLKFSRESIYLAYTENIKNFPQFSIIPPKVVAQMYNAPLNIYTLRKFVLQQHKPCVWKRSQRFCVVRTQICVG